MAQTVNLYFWGALLLPLTLFSGVLLTARCGFFQFTKFFKIIKTAFSKSNGRGVSPFGAMCTALSGTMGIGNIAGVGTAIALGGCGSVFWMTVSAFLCMAIKFSEVALAVKYRESTGGEWRGGLMYIINSAIPALRPLGFIFAALTAVSSVGTGGVSQSGCAAAAVQSAFGLPKWASGAIIGGICLLILCCSAHRLSNIAAKAVPLLSAMFVLGCCCVIAVNFSEMPAALREIISDAFNFRSAAGGAAGFAVSSALRYGVSRGIFTNEAGMGSAPIIHSEAAADPLKQGCLGVVEVLLDTVIMCPITALAVICSGAHRLCGVSPVNFTMAAFGSAFGSIGVRFVALSTLMFAVGSCVGWSFYGRRCCEYLFGTKRSVRIYSLVFCAVTAAGACLPELQIFEMSDIFNGLMMLPNLIVLVILSKEAGYQAKRLK